MKIHNSLPLLVACLKDWETLPTEKEFVERYAKPMEKYAGDFFEDHYSVLAGLDWKAYRDEAMVINPKHEELRVKKHLSDVEGLFEFKLEGDIILCGAFTAMDGYARFDRGGHQVFLGVDESHGRGKYLDVLITHELTHVARESRPEVWEGFGLNPKMTQDEFTESQPVIEHLMSEGFSCAVSEILVPGQDPWGYAYQDRSKLAFIVKNGFAVDKAIHKELRNPDGDYGHLYRSSTYTPRQPIFAHYVWAWQWVKHILRDQMGGDPKKLVARCSKEFMEDALKFELKKIR